MSTYEDLLRENLLLKQRVKELEQVVFIFLFAESVAVIIFCFHNTQLNFNTTHDAHKCYMNSE